MTLDRFHYLRSYNALKAVSNRTFDAHLTYNWCHFISSFCLRLLFCFRLEWLFFIFASVYSSTLIPLFSLSPSLSSQFLKHIIVIFWTYSCLILSVVRFLSNFSSFRAVFHRNFIGIYTSKERIANASEAILQMLLFLPDLHPPRVP